MLRRLIVIPVIALFASVIFGLHYYLAQRLIMAPAWPAGWTTALNTLVFVLAATLVLAPMAERLLERRYARLVVWPGSIWMGTGWILLAGLAATDVVVGLLGAMGTDDLAPLAARVRAVGLVSVAVPVALLALRQGLSKPRVTRVRIGLSRWPSSLRRLRIVQISDIHISTLLGRDFAEWLVDRVNGLEPDLIAVTGDLVDGRVDHLRDSVAPFSGLRAPMGVYFVTGNHDHYSGGQDWVDEVTRLGFRPLRNEHVDLDVGGRPVVLAGVDDHHGSFGGDDGGEDLDAALEQVGADQPVILLAHDPRTFVEAAKRGVDLQISGHTHGGQIWPFNYLVRLVTPWVAGLYRVGDSQIWVSRGTGFWGPPMRLGSPAEITELSIGPPLSSLD